MLDHGPTSALPWSASSATLCGPQHAANEDASIALPDAGVFVVADGMGGHTDGGLASRSVVEIVRRVAALSDSLEERVADIEAALHSVNEALRREAASRPGHDVVIGSTVAALIIDGHHAVCVWSGDSRIYLWRAGHLYQLTTDHSLAVEEGDVRGGMLTHAVGSHDVLVLDRVATRIEAGDTFLVCSDGVTKALSDEDLSLLLAGSLDGLAGRLVNEAMAAGARDDVSVILVRCSRDDA